MVLPDTMGTPELLKRAAAALPAPSHHAKATPAALRGFAECVVAAVSFCHGAMCAAAPARLFERCACARCRAIVAVPKRSRGEPSLARFGGMP